MTAGLSRHAARARALGSVTLTRSWGASAVIAPAASRPASLIVTSQKFIAGAPMKPATKRVAGLP